MIFMLKREMNIYSFQMVFLRKGESIGDVDEDSIKKDYKSEKQ